MKMRDWGKLILWAFGIASIITLVFCAPLIWGWLKSIHAASSDPQYDKLWGYLLIFVAARWFLVQPIDDRLRDIARELRESNRVAAREKE